MKQGLKQGFRLALCIVAPAAAMFALAGCATPDTDSGPGSAHVFAAASLSTVGEQLADTFAEEHPDAEIMFNFAGSSALVRQMGEGAPADLFISADVANMDNALELEEFTGAEVEIIATNRLVLVTAEGNPGQITGLTDITDRPVAICAPEVPCGALATQALDHAGVELNSRSAEANVTDVATKIATGAVDAGFLYSTDAQALSRTQDITGIELDGIEPNESPAALTTEGQDNEVAGAFAEFLTSEKARVSLADYGFGTD